MTTTDTVSGEVELKGTHKINKLILISEQELTSYQNAVETPHLSPQIATCKIGQVDQSTVWGDV